MLVVPQLHTNMFSVVITFCTYIAKVLAIFTLLHIYIHIQYIRGGYARGEENCTGDNEEIKCEDKEAACGGGGWSMLSSSSHYILVLVVSVHNNK